MKLLEFNNSKKIYYNSKKCKKWKPFVRFYKKTCNEYIANRNNNDIAKRTVKEPVSNILFKFRSYSKANNNANCYIPNVSSVYKLFKSNPKYAFKIGILPILSVEKGKEQKTEKRDVKKKTIGISIDHRPWFINYRLTRMFYVEMFYRN